MKTRIILPVSLIAVSLFLSGLACSTDKFRRPTATPTPTQTPTPTPTPTQTPIPEAGDTTVSEKDGMILVYVPAGEFLMGTSEEQKASQLSKGIDPANIAVELPQHTVWLDAFWIDKTEVTNDQFRQFINITGYRTDAEQAGKASVFDFTLNAWLESDGVNWMHPQGQGSDLTAMGNYPVTVVSWNDATAYCTWAGRRLPTEAEWEKAARGTDQRDYPWGSQDPVGNMVNLADKTLNTSWSNPNFDDGTRMTAPVFSFEAGASPYGALDMAGNVWEWVADWYGSYDAAAQRNPLGPAGGDFRVERGGGWFNMIYLVRTTARDKFIPTYADFNGGFRCALSAGK
jgi:eukaryotic-like serine/threonine-protein kinase